MLNRDQVVEILRLISCENLVCDRKEFIFDTFIYSTVSVTVSTVRITWVVNFPERRIITYYIMVRSNERTVRLRYKCKNTGTYFRTIRYKLVHVVKGHCTSM